jgi:hypothetical protein
MLVPDFSRPFVALLAFREITLQSYSTGPQHRPKCIHRIYGIYEENLTQTWKYQQQKINNLWSQMRSTVVEWCIPTVFTFSARFVLSYTERHNISMTVCT